MPAATPRPCPALPGALSAPRAAYQRAQPAAARPARGEPRGQHRKGSGATRGCGGGSVRPGLKTQSGERGWGKPGERRRGAERGGAGPRPYPGRLRSAGGSGLPEEGGRRSGRRRARGAGRPGREGTGEEGMERAWTGPGPGLPAPSGPLTAPGRPGLRGGGSRCCTGASVPASPRGGFGVGAGGAAGTGGSGCIGAACTDPKQSLGGAQIPNSSRGGTDPKRPLGRTFPAGPAAAPGLCSLTRAAAEVFGWLNLGWL